MELEPRHAENDRIVSEVRDVESDVLCMRTDLELNRKRVMSDSARRNETSIRNLEFSRGCFETERDGVGLRKGGVDEGRNGAGVDHC
jgi:hypothetical protein